MISWHRLWPRGFDYSALWWAAAGLALALGVVGLVLWGNLT